MFSKYYGQVNEDTRGTLKEDDNFGRAYKAKAVVALQKMLKAINFNYKKSEDPTKTIWQAIKDLILIKQHKRISRNTMRISKHSITLSRNSIEVIMAVHSLT